MAVKNQFLSTPFLLQEMCTKYLDHSGADEGALLGAEIMNKSALINMFGRESPEGRYTLQEIKRGKAYAELSRMGRSALEEEIREREIDEATDLHVKRFLFLSAVVHPERVQIQNVDVDRGIDVETGEKYVTSQQWVTDLMDRCDHIDMFGIVHRQNMRANYHALHYEDSDDEEGNPLYALE